jgi:hypothetical protein
MILYSGMGGLQENTSLCKIKLSFVMLNGAYK